MALTMDEEWSSKLSGYRTLGGRYRTPIIVLAVLSVLCMVLLLVAISFWAAAVEHQQSANSSSDHQSQFDDLATNSCPEGYVTIMGRCFLFSGSTENSWDEAREHCRRNGGDLAVIDDCRLMGTIIGYIHANALHPGEGYWIGGSDNEVESDWRWINGAKMDMDVPFWGMYSGSSLISEPSVDSRERNCIMLYKDNRYYFHDATCGLKRTVVCQTGLEAGGLCSAPSVKILDDCYQFLSEEQSWSDGAEACKILGGRLAVLDDCKAFGAVVRHIQSNGLTDSNGYWVAGNDKETEGEWLWTDGSHVQLGPPFWGMTGDATPEPAGGSIKNCAVMLKRGRYYYHAVSCLYLVDFTPLCQAPSTQ